MTGEVASARPLNLDHACAKVGELTRGERCRHGLFQRDDHDAFEWAPFRAAFDAAYRLDEAPLSPVDPVIERIVGAEA